MSDDHRNKILEQYDSTQGREFYKIVFGDYGLSVHYGIYLDKNDTMAEASENVITYLASLANAKGMEISHGIRVLDLGSGNGETAHYLAQKYGCNITCLNICPKQNATNLNQAEKLGIRDKIRVVEGDFENLPEGWSERFDLAWSEQAFCHAKDHFQLVKNMKQVMKSGGVVVFTDCMRSELAGNDVLESFAEVNAVVSLATPSDYLKYCLLSGYQQVSFHDLTHYLPSNFRKMMSQVDRYREALIQRGVSEDFIDTFRNCMERRVDLAEQHYFSWCCFSMIA